MSLLLLLTGITEVHAQDRPFRGIVQDSEGNPLPGCVVTIKGTQKGTNTNEAGRFNINVPPSANYLVFSFIGKKTREVNVTGKNTDLVIELENTSSSLDEVLVVGYGSQRRRDLTGAITSVAGKEMMKAAPVELLSALQGRAAGVQVRASEGAPGSALNIQIRGANSFSGASPLYVIDGIPFNGSNSPSQSTSSQQRVNPLAHLNPSDIESIEVLKDASATAIYGSRGSNGVVLITTRKGKLGPDKVEYNMNVSLSQPTRKLKVLDAPTYATMMNEAAQTANDLSGTNMVLPYSGQMVHYPIADKWVRMPTPEEFAGKGTNWQDVIFQDAVTQNHTLTVSGGNNAGNHLLSLGYVDQQGIIIGSRYKKLSMRMNLNRNIRNWLVVGTNISVAKEENDFVKTNTQENVFAAGITRSALTYLPTVQVVDTVTNTETLVADLINPYLYITKLKNKVKNTSLYTSTYAEVNLMPGLKFRQNIGVHMNSGKREEYVPIVMAIAEKGIAYVSYDSWNAIVSESILTYMKSVGRHWINATAVGVLEKSEYESRYNKVTTFPSDFFETNNFGAATGIPMVGNGKSSNSLASGLVRLNYAYDGRYSFTASMRADGASKFSRLNKWAYFPSAAFAWTIKNEPLLKDVNAITDLKLRLSYGKTGNQAIGSYATQNKLTPAMYPINGGIISGFADSEPGNDQLKWETTDQYNAGLDASFLNGRVGFTLELYQKKTSDLLQSIVIPGSTGFTRKLVNSGVVQNRGLELTVNGTPISNKVFSWNVSGNITFNRNKILALADGITQQFAGQLDHRAQNAPFIQKVGYPIGTLYGRVEKGLFKNEAQVRAVPEYANLSNAAVRAMIGEIHYADLDGNGVVDNNDRTITGDVNPKFFYGFTTDFRYRNFDLNIFINGVYGGDLINMNNQFLQDFGTMYNTTQEAYDNRWTPETAETATVPKAWYTFSRNFYLTRRFFESASFLRLRNVALGYNLKLNNSRILESCRFYLNANNLVTITKYKGFDPDVNAFGNDPARRGVDFGSYPASRTFNLGVQVNF